MAAVTYQGAVLKLSGTDVSDEATTFTLNANTDIPTVMTFDGQASAQGATTYDGEMTVVYDYTTGSAYNLLQAEVASPTSGGYQVIFEPEGTTSGKERITALCVLGRANIEAEGDGGVQLRTYPFVVTGTPTFATQT